MVNNPFRIACIEQAHDVRGVPRVAWPVLSWLLGLRAYRRLYDSAASSDAPFERRALSALDVRAQCAARELEAVPTAGPLLVVANHPHGVLDGLLLASLLSQVRSDVRILANRWLSHIPDLADRCFFVDPSGDPAATMHNRAGVRGARGWLANGGALIVFPSGEVAHERGSCESYTDPAWHVTVGRLAVGMNGRVVPAFIAGRNSPWFYAAGRVHPALRTALLPRELLKKRGQTVTVRLGAPMSSADCAATGSAAAATALMRSAVEALRSQPSARPAPNPKDTIAAEVLALPRDACLIDGDRYQVFGASAQRIPSVMQEMGRLREETYRAVGEGTGKAIDLDEFDESYLHLFLWDRDEQRIAGAYRLGRTDHIVAARGVEGLYTRSSFRYDAGLIGRLSPALELGRAFVRAEYQKNYNALLLLWKGIAQFVARHPEYRVLFGSVSISPTYSAASRQLLVGYLQQHHGDPALASLVDPIHPFAIEPAAESPWAGPQSVEDANRLVLQSESDGKGMPILLRQYLKLGARLIGVNVDHDFGNALDALMVVDLARVNPAILDRFFGRNRTARLDAGERRHSVHAA